MFRKITVLLATLAAVFAFSVAPSNAVTLWQETHCQNHVIGGAVLDPDPVVQLCVQTNYGLQADGDGIRVNEVIFQVTKGCSYLERDGGGFVTGLRTSIFGGPLNAVPLDSDAFSPMFSCGPVHRITGLAGFDSGRAHVVTNAHVRIDLANDWNPVFDYNLCRNNAC